MQLWWRPMSSHQHTRSKLILKKSVDLTVSLRPMSHVRFVTRVRAAKSQTVELHTATLSRKPFHDRPPQTQFQNSETSISTGVNPAGDTSPNILVGGTSTGISPPILLRTFGYSRPILVALRSLSLKPISFGYKTPPIIASVRQADSRLTRLVPPTFNSRWTTTTVYLIFSELFDRSYAFVSQNSLLKLNHCRHYRNQSCRSGLSQRATDSVTYVNANSSFFLLLYCTDFIIYALYM